MVDLAFYVPEDFQVDAFFEVFSPLLAFFSFLTFTCLFQGDVSTFLEENLEVRANTCFYYLYVCLMFPLTLSSLQSNTLNDLVTYIKVMLGNQKTMGQIQESLSALIEEELLATIMDK